MSEDQGNIFDLTNSQNHLASLFLLDFCSLILWPVPSHSFTGRGMRREKQCPPPSHQESGNPPLATVKAHGKGVGLLFLLFLIPSLWLGGGRHCLILRLPRQAVVVFLFQFVLFLIDIFYFVVWKTVGGAVGVPDFRRSGGGRGSPKPFEGHVG